MKKFTSLSRVKKITLVLALSLGVIVFLAFTKRQILHSQTKLVVAEDTDDDEPLSSTCGGAERWSEKVFTDTGAVRIDFAHPHPSSVTHLIGLPTVTPSTYQNKIEPQEDSVYTVVVHITEYRPESDSDCHLVITDGVNTMVAEVPDPGCSSVAASPKVADFIVCRDWVYKNLGYVINTSVNLPLVQITGVAYYDPPHGQSGAAPNNLELHSVIAIGFYSPTSIDNIAGPTGVNVYPIPNHGQFNVAFSKEKGRLLVYNMIGEQVYDGALSQGNNPIDMLGRASGIYIYNVVSETGEFISGGKLSIQ
ncbi:MAG: T9SS type A sorting domain-containing protein [Bacteroidia bacterium]